MGQSGRTIDFIVIGAQKAATTSLHRYLYRHPQLYLPAGKEAVFFTNDARWDRGWHWFFEEFFAGAPAEARLGKVCPQYMSDGRAPGRIGRTLPAVKLIASLRNPVDRALSHYRMSVRQGLERRSLEDAMRHLMDPAVAARARTLPAGRGSESCTYLAWGEYGRILSSYLDHFSARQLLVIFGEELGVEPAAVLRRLLRFIGVDEEYRPPNLGARYHRGAERQRWPWLRPVLRRTPAKHMWQRLPARWKDTLGFWYTQVNVTRGSHTPLEIPPVLREELVAYFTPDVQTLQNKLCIRVPWSDFHGLAATDVQSGGA